MSEAEPAAGPAMLRVDDVDGLPTALGRRLAESDANPSERTAIAHDHGAQTTVVRARDTAALEWLYDWLDTYDGDERVERAAADVATAVEAELETRLVTDGGEKIQTNTRVGHCKADPFDIYIGRGAGGRDMLETPIGKRGWLGNPHTVEDHGREESIERFRKAFEHRLETDAEFRARVRDLAGKRLGCWCQRLDEDEPACHGEVIAGHADRLAREAEPIADGGTAQEPVDARAWQPRRPRCQCGTLLAEFVSRVEARRLARMYGDDGEIPACPACTAPRSGETGATDIPTAIKVKTAHYRGEGL